ncbi:Disease resistance protein RPP13 [Abeliophyllum distichum]|uniref:Disease resistance protein RPP13 n=1 Tax=Abeliophyllum distichum TaxID=126358 RepID=A0ABD1V6P3_9LAMI
MASPIYYLRQAQEFKHPIPGMPRCNGKIFLSVCNYLIKLCQQDDKVISLLEQLNDSVKKGSTLEDQSFTILLRSFVKELKQFNRLEGLADILRKVEQVKEKIKEQCTAVSWKMLTPKTSMVSLFHFDSLLDDLNLIMIQKYETSFDVKDQIRTIVEELKSLQSFLEDMEVQKHPELEGFLIKTSNIAYEVLYILTSYAPVWYLSLRLPQVMEKIKHIRLPLEKLNKYPAEQVSSQDEKPLEDIVVDFHVETNRISGMLKDVENPSQKAPFIEKDISDVLDDEANEITEILLGNQKEQQIISIWGMPGLGKTTLAKKIFNDDTIVQHFHIRTFCVFSQTYDKKNTLIAILTSMSSLERDELSKLDEDTLGGKIYKSLCGKGIRYLIILDDIWEDVWSDLHRYFPENQSESRLLFTTRFEKIGSQASDKSIVRNLRFLTDDECWKLLKIKVFHNVQLEDIGRKIASKCGGLPLAVIVIAAVLANMKKNKTKWEEVAQSLSTHISKDNSCMKKLELSYSYLPMHLKPCFLYFGAFEEDTEIPVQKLISLWVSEGFVQKGKQKNSNDVSYGYLIDLISRGLVQVGKRRSNGGVKTCYVHDLLHEMCLTIAEKYNFMKVIKGQLPIYVPHHRLSILSRSITHFSRPFGLHVCSMLGYLLEPSRFIFSNMKLVKVLDLSIKWLRETKIEKLDLLSFFRASSLPSSIGLCRNLEYLFMDTFKDGHLENTIKMVKLRHVHFKGEVLWDEREIMYESFQKNNLEALSTFLIEDENDLKFLRCSPFLRRLKCKFSSNYNPSKPYSYPILNFLNHLESLSIFFMANGHLSNLISLPLNLKKLTLTYFNLNSKEMKIIGELPKLEVLKLESCSIEDYQWNPNEDEFQQLRFLKLVSTWVELNVSSDHFPRLEQLVLTESDTLIPSNLGDIPTLMKIEVKWCKKQVEEAALKILEEQQDNGNELLNVTIISSGRSG